MDRKYEQIGECGRIEEGLRHCDSDITSHGEGFAPSPSLDQEGRPLAALRNFPDVGKNRARSQTNVPPFARLRDALANLSAACSLAWASGASGGSRDLPLGSLLRCLCIDSSGCAPQLFAVEPQLCLAPVPPSPLIGAVTWRCCHRRCWCR